MIKQSFPLKTSDEMKLPVSLPARLSGTQTIFIIIPYIAGAKVYIYPSINGIINVTNHIVNIFV